MRRRLLIAVLVGIALAPLLSAGAAEPARMFHVGMVNLNVPRSAPFTVAFAQRLREHGFVEGKNLAIDFLGLDGHIDRLPELEELVRRKVAVILAAGQGYPEGGNRATGTIPIVMVAVTTTPSRSALSGASPGRAAISPGLSDAPELSAKRLALLKETVPGIARAIVFWDAEDPPCRCATTAAQSFGCRSNRSNWATRPMISKQRSRLCCPGPATRSCSRRLSFSFATVIA